MPFHDLDALLDHGLKLPIGGKTYHVHSPTAKLGLAVLRMFTFGMRIAAGDEISKDEAADLEATAEGILDDEREQELYQRLLQGICPDCGGEWNVYDDLMEATSWPVFQLVGQTVVSWIVNNCDNAIAEEFWNRGGAPLPKSPDPIPTPPTESAKPAPRDYRESTKTPTKRPARKAAASPGGKSSGTGH